MDSYFYYCSECDKLFKVSGSGKKVKCSKCSGLLYDLGVTSEEYALLDNEAKEAIKHNAKKQKPKSVESKQEQILSDSNYDGENPEIERNQLKEDMAKNSDSAEKAVPMSLHTVKVNLDYNPYLMEYNTLFNGKEPRINSAIEKYTKYPLQMWVNEVPHILYDEMNGYDFDLEFTGPEMDYQDLEKSFIDAGITVEDVKCIHKRVLENRKGKLQDISELINWLEVHRNKRLDYDSFRIENQDVFENDYPIIVVGEKCPGEFAFENANVSIEVISDAKELDNTVLKNTPIIFECAKLLKQSFRDLLSDIIDNADVIDEQFFFYISPKDNYDMFYRLIQDLGIKAPIMIDNMDDDRLGKFFEYYPISDYIRVFLKTLRDKVDDIKSGLNAEKEESDKVNGEIIAEITKIEDHIATIKDSISKLNDVIKTNIAVNWVEENEKLLQTIISWKSKKTKITNDEEAVRLSEQYEEEIKYHWNQYIESLASITYEYKNAILLECTEAYNQAADDGADQEVSVMEQDSEIDSFDKISSDLIRIKEEKYEKPKEGLLNAFLKTNTSEPKELVLVTTYPCQKWREYASGLVIPLMEKKTGERDEELKDYCNSVASDYIEKLNKILKRRVNEKVKTSAQLSEDIQILQKDIDWVNELSDILESIERD